MYLQQENNMDLWIIADSHLGYTGVGEGIERPKDFSERILKSLANVLKPESVLLHLGDICYNDDDLWNFKLTSLPGKKWLVLGNHDKKSASWYVDKNWDAVCESMSLNMFGKRILFSHKPMMTDISFMSANGHYMVDKYDINIHGHFHNFSFEKVKTLEPQLFNLLNKKHFLVSQEKFNYQPIKLKRIVELFNTGKYHGLENALNP